MSEPFFPHLFSEITVGKTTLKNRLVSTGHHTYLADKYPSDELIAYHEARAQGGVGLIVSEIVAVHETAAYSSMLLNALDEESIPHYTKLARSVQKHGSKLFAQLFHPGREILSSHAGFAPIAYSPSAVPNERFHIMPKEMSAGLIEEIIAGYATSARHLALEGLDGVEIVGSHGYLPAQFLSPQVNRRDDAYGGDFDRRLAFVKEVVRAIRESAPSLVVGLRLSANEMDSTGVDAEPMAEICAALDGDVDYFSLVAGTSAGLGSSVHIVPPMGVSSAYVADLCSGIRNRISSPLIVTGRINQPQEAERIIANGQADMCGMTRALICDPMMPAKASDGLVDDIRACIGCDQACIGRAHKGLPISCIQNPQSGREMTFPNSYFTNSSASKTRKKVWVVGGGPGGMKAVTVAALRGHRVTLFEKNSQVGGQTLLAQRLTGREEFGGIVTNFSRELECAGVNLELNTDVNANLVRRHNPDKLIVATGAREHSPELDVLETSMIAGVSDVLLDKVPVGSSVAIADWKADWIGIGIAEKLAYKGHRVQLFVNAATVGESLQIYTRNHYVGRLYKLGVQMTTHARLFGAEGGTVYFQNTLSEEPIIVEDIDTLVLSLGHQPDNELERELANDDIDSVSIGDCVVARTAEEAVYEGLLAAIGA